MKTKLPLYLALLLLTQCSKCKNDPAPADPASQLPPATQTGANTFGCLINGQAYVPQGNSGTPNLAVIYDPNFNGGALNVISYNCSGDCAKAKRTIQLGGEGIRREGIYSLMTSGQHSASFFDRSKLFPCSEYSGNGGAYVEGELKIVRLDTQTGIVSGTFNFKTAQPGCDTIKITQGRFDARF